MAALEVAGSLEAPVGAYTVQAAIAACHARALTVEETDWAGIAGLYSVLREVCPSPVVDLNRAVAVGMVEGPEAGIEIVDGLVASGALHDYPMAPAVRADLLQRLGRRQEAAAEFERVAQLTRNELERTIFRGRARECRGLTTRHGWLASMTDVTVRDNPAAHRYEAVIDGTVAGFAAYAVAQGIITFTHTEVDDAFEGRGVGSALAQGAMDDVRAQGTRKVRTTCPFISAWLRRHPENNDLLAPPRH